MSPGVWPGAEVHTRWAVWVVAAVLLAAVPSGVVLLVRPVFGIEPGELLIGLAWTGLISGIGFGAPALAWCAVRGVPRVERRVVATRGRLCPFCGHDLSGRPDARRREAAPCPECGRVVSTRDAVLFWCRQLRRAVKP